MEAMSTGRALDIKEYTRPLARSLPAPIATEAEYEQRLEQLVRGAVPFEVGIRSFGPSLLSPRNLEGLE